MHASAKLAVLLAAVCPLLMASCGGGGTSPGHTVTGVLILGPASGADIEAYALFELGTIGLRPLGTTRTASDGGFAVGSFAMAGFEPEYDDSDSYPPAARARTRLSEGVVRSGSTAADVGSTGGTFKNTETDPEADGSMEMGMGLTVDPDGTMSVTTAIGVLEGGASADGRYAFVIPGDPPAAIQNLLLFRR